MSGAFQTGGHFFAEGIWVFSAMWLSNRDLRNRAVEKRIRMKAEKTNRKAGIKAQKSGYRQATVRPFEYENIPFPKKKLKNIICHVTHALCPLRHMRMLSSRLKTKVAGQGCPSVGGKELNKIHVK